MWFSRSVNGAAVFTWVRNAKVFTNIPTSASSDSCPRPAMGEPMVMSALLPNRASSAANAAWTTMNRLAPDPTARSRSRSAVSEPIVK